MDELKLLADEVFDLALPDLIRHCCPKLLMILVISETDLSTCFNTDSTLCACY